MDFLKKYWVYIALPVLTAVGVVVFLFASRNDVAQFPPPPPEEFPPVGFPPPPPPMEPVPLPPPTPAAVDNPNTLSTEQKYTPTSDSELKKLFEAMKKKS